ncbi:Stp1/IreP family PP2C-type Ser/Thr phosphatase [Staphylococcus saccharolyticus]|uniref:Stp1/IreP family PP2C-type Ser/Thr phosphatase n=1 Tax=Staphylococcus saccharolyticus TaxID=33028 RepID=UPI00102D6D31|nr:Stp1/IreP family PP2C-type Ser/Thr phosphatase [Staphylococcus saccharolyticus]MBL7573030.1 Stp1/IreP family PP2C-type Ser/Thr phosphatase [Staphylococcus saccharolyticus]MBL7584036.1 Stp1/IreP family PP2C-type Ser/Thr phosphatase [Staphylococcus saccharolyticus]MBL7638645.1 Stp1/IreP family PP2C-type Ser/Thr phosphatase [Staphylococcus saccharolyticus]QRJ67859.1 Stp1/IreP family PP2C-type Ser/Thr phosphatase [Staphylococcus saccharolyticus]TAA93559.1 Stp1/IreP family PP2C-type Ser/Thr phos
MLNAQFFTDTGQHREKNEDAGGIFYNQTQQQMLVLCDGMGGHKAGEIASQFVTYELQKRFEDENLIEIDRAESWLRSNIKDINFQLYNYAQENNEYRGMGTTLVCAIIFDKEIVVANVGDSRSYVINQRRMDQITSDHSFVNHLVMTGQITKEEAFNHPQRNIITKVMGTDKRVSPDLFIKKTQFYDFLLLNSDGLTDYVRDYEIQEVLNEEASLDDHGEKLLSLAMAHDSKDNVSFILSSLEGGKV